MSSSAAGAPSAAGAAPSSANASGAPAPIAPAPAAPGSGAGDAASRKSPLLKKQRILWDSDAATRGGKTSITVLLEWLAAPGNYDRWRAGKSQFGETREMLCTQIKAEMKKHGILHRENANIRTQVSELERSYDTAVKWLVQNGYDGKIPGASTLVLSELPPGLEGSLESSNPVEAYVLRTCRYFHVFDTIIRKSSLIPASSGSSSSLSPSATSVSRKRPRYSRISLKKPAAGDEEGLQQQQAQQSGGSEEGSSEKTAEAPLAVPTSPGATTASSTASSTESRTDEPAVSPSAMVTLVNRATERRQPALLSQKRKSESPVSVGASSSSTFSSANSDVGVIVPVPVPATNPGNAAVQPVPTAALLETNLATYENTQRVVFEAAREERDRKRFLMEEEKCKLECEKLRYEVQAANLKLKVERALAKKQLAGAGLSHTEIDALLEL